MMYAGCAVALHACEARAVLQHTFTSTGRDPVKAGNGGSVSKGVVGFSKFFGLGVLPQRQVLSGGGGGEGTRHHVLQGAQRLLRASPFPSSQIKVFPRAPSPPPLQIERYRTSEVDKVKIGVADVLAVLRDKSVPASAKVPGAGLPNQTQQVQRGCPGWTWGWGAAPRQCLPPPCSHT